MTLPKTTETISTLVASQEAKETLNNILERKQLLEDYVAVVQPLLFTLSKKLCGDVEELPLADLIKMSIDHINGNVVTIEAKEVL